MFNPYVQIFIFNTVLFISNKNIKAIRKQCENKRNKRKLYSCGFFFIMKQKNIIENWEIQLNHHSTMDWTSWQSGSLPLSSNKIFLKDSQGSNWTQVTPLQIDNVFTNNHAFITLVDILTPTWSLWDTVPFTNHNPDNHNTFCFICNIQPLQHHGLF